MRNNNLHNQVAIKTAILLPLAFVLSVMVIGATQQEPVLIGVRPINSTEAARVSFTHDIRPLLVQKCLGCHAGASANSRFEVTSVRALLKGGNHGPAIVPGKPDESLVVEYVRGIRQPRMPKDEAPLNESELHLIRMWIHAGAPDDASSADRLNLVAAHQVNKQLVSDFGASPGVIDSLLFSADNEEFFVGRRSLRITQVPPPPTPPRVGGPAYNPIDQFIVAKWEGEGLDAAQRPPEVCSDAVFLRRVYLDLIGLIPTIEEAKRFLSDPSSNKRVKLVNDLLSRSADYAAHWVPFWEEALGSSTARLQGGIPTRGDYSDWIYRSFFENKPFDVMVAELIDPTMPGHKQAVTADLFGKVSTVGYIRNDTHQDTLQSAANVAQVFLGTSMKCASCHNHFLNQEWPQVRFLGFAGLFAAGDLELIRCEQKTGQIIPARFPFEMVGTPSTVPNDGLGRLRRVTQLLTDPTNPRFGKTIVNRLWKRYLGLGLYEPADDFRLDRLPSHPELLEWLTYDFMKHGYDLKHTIRLILTSRTYQLRYDPALEDHFDVTKPDKPRYYRSPSLRRLTAEQVIDSVRVATNQEFNPRQRLHHTRTSTPLTRALGRPASRNEISTSRPDDVAVVQALELMNGDEFHWLVYSGRLGRELPPTDLDPVVEKLYWAAYSRPPSPLELKQGNEFLRDNLPTDRETTLPVEITWIDDSLPTGAKPNGSGGAESWLWVSGSKHPVFSGGKSHTQGGTKQTTQGETGQRMQHFFTEADQPLEVGPQAVLFTYVYLDPVDPPRQIMLQWSQGEGWDHRAYWGEDLELGDRKSLSSHFIWNKATRMGALPRTGVWVRLEIPATEVGLDIGRRHITGWSFGEVDGVAYWDKAGIVTTPMSRASAAIGDMLWALLSSPLFQYIY